MADIGCFCGNYPTTTRGRVMTEKPQAKLPSGQVVKWKELDHPSVYANIIGFGMSQFDINLIFGEIGDSTPSQAVAIPKVKVFLTPEQAANTMKLLSVALEAYVAGNGHF